MKNYYCLNPRGFANEYKIIIVRAGNESDKKRLDYLKDKVDQMDNAHIWRINRKELSSDDLNYSESITEYLWWHFDEAEWRDL